MKVEMRVGMMVEIGHVRRVIARTFLRFLNGPKSGLSPRDIRVFAKIGDFYKKAKTRKYKGFVTSLFELFLPLYKKSAMFASLL